MISIIIPVFNEHDLIGTTVLTVHDYLKQRNFPHEIIVVNNGSTDATGIICEMESAKHDWLRYYSLNERAVGQAIAVGIKEAQGDFVVTLDADLSSDLVFLDYVHHLMEYCDALVGSKSLGKQRRGLIRIMGSQLYIMISQMVFGLAISDYSLGAKAFRRSAVIEVVNHMDAWTGCVFDSLLYLSLKGKPIIQIGIECVDERKSHFNLWHEGLYRYYHLYKAWKLVRDRRSWLYGVKS